MVDPIDDIARQARQGSVAAVIQMLNEKLADQGVRTRAMFDNQVLQLLCEAASPEQLEQTTLVRRVKLILESISPRNVRRVNINSRIVREQQLLWLDEIKRDPVGQLLWSEEIVLARPNPLKRWLEDRRDRTPDKKSAMPATPSSRQLREQHQFQRGILGGTALSLVVLLGGYGLWQWLGSRNQEAELATAVPPAPTSPTPVAASPSPVAVSPSPQPKPAAAGDDAFTQAVRLAEQAAQDGPKAKTSAQWLELATRWQQAADLMKQVPAKDSRSMTARDRAKLYQKFSESAIQQAKRRK